jgi:hypothetical protein
VACAAYRGDLERGLAQPLDLHLVLRKGGQRQGHAQRQAERHGGGLQLTLHLGNLLQGWDGSVQVGAIGTM